MINYQIRVLVTQRKKTLFERILNPADAAQCNVGECLTGLRQLFPHDSTITFECYGV